MSPEKQTKNLANQKQKLIIGAIVVIVLIVLWQFMGMGGGESTTIEPTPAANNRVKPAGMPSAPAAHSTMPMAAATPSVPASATSDMKEPRSAPLPINAEMTKLQQSQTEYIAALNKLQMLKLQKEIDEAKTAIATAELNRMTAEKNIADLITTKQDIMPVQNTVTPPATTEAGSTPTLTPPAPVVPVVVQEYPYTVLSVVYAKKWTAVVSGQGKLYNVAVGDVLPPDNSKVVAIDKQGVTIKKAGITRSLPISSQM